MTAPPRLVVAVLSYRRPGPLARLLEALLPQAEAARADVLVVDNDPLRSVPARLHPRVRVVHEPRPGIPAARNRALEEAREHDLLAFLDDDETPEPGWLQALLAELHRSGAAGVTGPVESVHEQPPTAWVQAGRFFARRRLPDGTPVQVAATNNLLLDLRVVRRLGLRFDERFRDTGGSDTLFTLQLTRSGAALTWAAGAVVRDHVPAERGTRGWVLRRSLRSGASDSRVRLLLDPRPGTAVRAGSRGAARLAGGLVRWLAGAVTGDLGKQAGGARTAARGAGMLGGCWGWSVQEYRR